MLKEINYIRLRIRPSGFEILDIIDLVQKYKIDFDLDEDDLTVSIICSELILNPNTKKFLNELNKIKTNNDDFHIFIFEDKKELDMKIELLHLIFQSYFDYLPYRIIDNEYCIYAKYVDPALTIFKKKKDELKWAENKPYIPVNQIRPNQIELGIDDLKDKIPFLLKLGLFKSNPELEEDLSMEKDYKQLKLVLKEDEIEMINFLNYLEEVKIPYKLDDDYSLVISMLDISYQPDEIINRLVTYIFLTTILSTELGVYNFFSSYDFYRDPKTLFYYINLNLLNNTLTEDDVRGCVKVKGQYYFRIDYIYSVGLINLKRYKWRVKVGLRAGLFRDNLEIETQLFNYFDELQKV